MLQIIIFSFDRALQLDALLDSLIKKWQSPDYHVDVLYNTSSPDFQMGYDRLQNSLASRKNIVFHKEGAYKGIYSIKELCNHTNLKHLINQPYLRRPKTDFRPLLIKLMKKSAAEDVMFLTDDSVFINEVNLAPDVSQYINEKPSLRSFSLRLGRNMNNPPASVGTVGNYLDWKYSDSKFMSNWGYVFSVDGHIYNRPHLLKIFKRIIFTNPNSLEGIICFYLLPQNIFSEGRANMDPAILSYPINMVQTVQDNESLNVSPQLLNTKYLEGYKICYPIVENPDIFQQYPHSIELRSESDVFTIKTDCTLKKART